MLVIDATKTVKFNNYQDFHNACRCLINNQNKYDYNTAVSVYQTIMRCYNNSNCLMSWDECYDLLETFINTGVLEFSKYNQAA